MNISINARHMSVSQAMRDYAEEKAAKLEKYFDRITSIEVILDTEGGNPFVEVIANAARSGTFVGTHRGEDMYGCVDNALHKVEEQLRRHKDKVRNRKGLSHEERVEIENRPEAVQE